jgi:hypothetical protein
MMFMNSLSSIMAKPQLLQYFNLLGITYLLTAFSSHMVGCRGHFQEINVESGEVLFEWRSLDHAETLPAMTYNTYGNNGTDNGSSVNTKWDYL